MPNDVLETVLSPGLVPRVIPNDRAVRLNLHLIKKCCNRVLDLEEIHIALDRLVNIALPRIKDFRGLNIDGFDKFGNYSFGIKEHIIFPEINFDKVDRIRGMDITIVTSGKNKEATLALLMEMNFPFAKVKKEKKHN